jgi:putative ABC transport system permease protein
MIILRPLFLKLLRDLWQRSGTLFALVLILATGISSYIGMAGVYHDLEQATKNYYQKYHLADFTLDLKGAPETIFNNLLNTPNVIKLRTRVVTSVMVKLLKTNSLTNITSHLPGQALSLPVPRQEIINNIKLYRGTWFSNSYAQEVILDEQFAKARHLKPGDYLKVLLPNKEMDFLIVGTAFSPEFVMILPPGGVLAPEPQNYAIMYMPEETLSQNIHLYNGFNQLLGMANNVSPIALQNTMQLLSEKLNAYGVLFQTAQEDQISVKVLHDELTHLKSVIAIFPTLFLIIAALILNVMMTRLIAQQRGIIGILKALGYTNMALVFHYLWYGVIIGCIGGCLGITAGLWLQKGMLYMYNIYFAIPDMNLHLYIPVISLGLGISLLSALLGTLFGVRQAAKLQPAEAMKAAMPEKAMHVLLEKITRHWLRYLSFKNKIVIRDILRNRVRSLVTIAACIVATAIVFSSISWIDAMHKMISHAFDLVQHQDYTLSLRDPLGKKILSTVSMLPNIAQVEAQLNIPVEMRYGPYLKRLEIIGLPSYHHLFTPLDSSSRPIILPSTGLVLTTSLAKMLHVKVGDQIFLKPLLGERKTTKAMVVTLVPSYIGFTAYANQQWLSNLLGDSWLANTILFKLKKSNDNSAFIEKVNQFSPMINLVQKDKSREVLIETLNQFISFSLTIMILFAGIIAIGSIMNTSMVSFNERERDIASLRILGFTNLQVAQIFFLENGILNGLGIGLGLLLGIYFTYLMSTAMSTELFSMPFVIKPLRLSQAVFIMCLFVIFSQGMIYYIIRRLNWFAILNNRE